MDTADLWDRDLDHDRFVADEEVDAVLVGAVDLHQHPSPSPFPRRMSIVDAARDAAAAGFRALAMKSHHHSTVTDVLALRDEMLDEIPVFVAGGIALNNQVGGINPFAVETALKQGGRIVWFPTLAAQAHIDHHAKVSTGFPSSAMRLRSAEPVPVLGEGGQLLPAVQDVLEVIAAEDAVLACGHLSAAEVDVLIRGAVQAGVQRIIVNHPTFVVDASIELCREWAAQGAYIEHCLTMYVSRPGQQRPLDELAAYIAAVGPDRTTISSDAGQKSNPLPVTLFRRVARMLLDRGIPASSVRKMVGDNAASVLGV